MKPALYSLAIGNVVVAAAAIGWGVFTAGTLSLHAVGWLRGLMQQEAFENKAFEQYAERRLNIQTDADDASFHLAHDLTSAHTDGLMTGAVVLAIVFLLNAAALFAIGRRMGSKPSESWCWSRLAVRWVVPAMMIVVAGMGFAAFGDAFDELQKEGGEAFTALLTSMMFTLSTTCLVAGAVIFATNRPD